MYRNHTCTAYFTRRTVFLGSYVKSLRVGLPRRVQSFRVCVCVRARLQSRACLKVLPRKAIIASFLFYFFFLRHFFIIRRIFLANVPYDNNVFAERDAHTVLSYTCSKLETRFGTDAVYYCSFSAPREKKFPKSPSRPLSNILYGKKKNHCSLTKRNVSQTIFVSKLFDE